MSVSLDFSSGGIPVIVNRMPDSLSSGFMVAVRTGSRDESAEIGGISHLLEHVVFRATETKTSYQMSKEIEGAGGISNAFTGKEVTAFFAVTIKDTAEVAKDYVSDIVSHPLISENDTELEKKIVLQELSMCENEPDSYIHELFDRVVWKGHRLEQDEGGKKEIVSKLTSRDLRKYYDERYRIPNLVVSASGDVTQEEAIEWTEANFDCLTGGIKIEREEPKVCNHVYEHFRKDLDHCYVGMGCAAFGPKDPDADALRILSTILGEGTSSRLFQQVREKNALVYSVYSDMCRYTDCQSIGTFMSSTGENVLKSIETVASVYRNLKDEGLTEGELQRAKNIQKGRFTRTSESSSKMLYFDTMNYIRTGKVMPVNEILKKLDEVTEEDVMRVADRVLNQKNFSVVLLSDEVKQMKDFSADQLDF